MMSNLTIVVVGPPKWTHDAFDQKALDFHTGIETYVWTMVLAVRVLSVNCIQKATTRLNRVIVKRPDSLGLGDARCLRPE
jgi:hypothetical protein